MIGVRAHPRAAGEIPHQATFFIPGHTSSRPIPTSAPGSSAEGHEIGHHGWTHRAAGQADAATRRRPELVRGNEAIRRLTGRNPRGYRSPSWDLSPHTVELLIRHGFVYDSSMMGNDYIALPGARRAT